METASGREGGVVPCLWTDHTLGGPAKEQPRASVQGAGPGLPTGRLPALLLQPACVKFPLILPQAKLIKRLTSSILMPPKGAYPTKTGSTEMRASPCYSRGTHHVGSENP